MTQSYSAFSNPFNKTDLFKITMDYLSTFKNIYLYLERSA